MIPGRRSLIRLLLAGLVGLAIPVPAARAESPEDILVVANEGVSVDHVSEAELRSFFLKQRMSWRNGGKVVAINARLGSTLRRDFQRRLLGMTAEEEQSYWQDQKIRRGVEEPPEFSNSLKAVFKIKGSVSYVYRHQYREGVAKILLVISE